MKADLEKAKEQHLQQEAEKVVLQKKLEELTKQEKEIEEALKKEKAAAAKAQEEKSALVQQETAKITNLADIAEKANKTAEFRLN